MSDVFEIRPVAKIITKANRSFLGVFKKYIKGLKEIHHFSHIILLIDDTSSNKDKRKPKLINESNVVKPCVVKLLSVDEKEGILEIENSIVSDGEYIYDIKPYYPIEERVKDYSIPKKLSSFSEWRNEKSCSVTKHHPEIIMPDIEDLPILLKPVGNFRRKDSEYKIELSGEYLTVLKNIKGFSHLIILWWFHRFEKDNFRKTLQVAPPYENSPKMGVFASRSPVRPNPVGMTMVRVKEIYGSEIVVYGFDAFDKTPVISLIPYLPSEFRVKKFSVPKWVSHWPEWYEEIKNDISVNPNELLLPDKEILLPYQNKSEELKNPEYNNESEIKRNSNFIEIIGARQNNLKNVNAAIPKNKITVVTGVSGSGKSSFAFDTIFAESQRRFMDSISTVGISLFDQLEKPDYDQIRGLTTAIAIEQNNFNRNPRSTVGTVTELYDYLRLLYAKIGIIHCPECGRSIVIQNAGEIINELCLLKSGILFSIFDPHEPDNERSFNSSEKEIQTESKLYIEKLGSFVKEVIDKSNGFIGIKIENNPEIILTTKLSCFRCNKIFFEKKSSMFSYNNPESMCPECNGLGVKIQIDIDSIVVNPEKSLLDGATSWWGNLRDFIKNPTANWMKCEALALAEVMKVDLELPWNKLPEEFKNKALYGTGDIELEFKYESPKRGRSGVIKRPGLGAVNHIKRIISEGKSGTNQEIVSRFFKEKECPVCHGERLSPLGRLVTICGKRYPEVAKMTIDDFEKWIVDIQNKLNHEEYLISKEIVIRLKEKLRTLIDMKAGYLALDRSVITLSGGESQRLRLSGQLSCGLSNLIYVLDEPTGGLHPKDNSVLIKALTRIRDEGNTLIVVEHDREMMELSDYIVDFGPGAGSNGGQLIFHGSPAKIMNSKDSLTGKYLRNELQVGIVDKVILKPSGWIELSGVSKNNLKGISVKFPLGVICIVTGVSGSGKSSLVNGTLKPAMESFMKNEHENIFCSKMKGADQIDKIISVTQLPIGRSPRSTPATYIGLFDEIRLLYSRLDDSINRGYKVSRFSFNDKEGCCESCGGEGRKKVEMSFLPDLWVPCNGCEGKRFNRDTLEIKYNGKSIADALEMDVDEAMIHFKNEKKIFSMLELLKDVGLDYIKLGQSALTLSGGEAQRVKLAKELCRKNTGKTLFLLDEPTSGLHFSDIQKLLNVLYKLTLEGNSVIIVEHNMELIKNADYIIDLGPEAGNHGGYIVTEGKPEEIIKNNNSHTGQILKKYFIRN